MKNRLLTVDEYAGLCGVTRAAIYTRIKNGAIKAKKVFNKTKTDEALVIDSVTYPPGKLKPGRKQFSI